MDFELILSFCGLCIKNKFIDRIVNNIWFEQNLTCVGANTIIMEITQRKNELYFWVLFIWD